MAFIPMAVDELRIGLYIKLECSWWNHPFAKNKFKVTSEKEIQTINGIGKVKLYYDPDLSDPEEEPGDEPIVAVPETADVAPTQDESQQDQERIQKGQVQACEEHTAELQKASYLYQQVLAQTKMSMKRICAGHAAGVKSADQVIHSLIHSLNKPETSMAMIDILTSSQTDDPFSAHVLNVCIVSLLVGMEYHLEDDELYALGLAGLLHDIGKQNFPTMLRVRQGGRTKGEQQEWSKHPELGKKSAGRFSTISTATVDAIFQHHERLDGSGFPLGLQGSDISFFAKIVMVADEYDHLCHQSEQSKSLTPAEALSRLYDHYIMKNLRTISDRIDGMIMEDVLEPNVAGTPVEGNGTGENTFQDKAEFSEEIVVSMVRALGVYPPGSLVELTNGSMGLVTGANSEERTKPCVMVCFPGVPRKEARIIDLTHDDQLSIVQNIRPQHLPQDVHEYFFSNR